MAQAIHPWRRGDGWAGVESASDLKLVKAGGAAVLAEVLGLLLAHTQLVTESGSRGDYQGKLRTEQLSRGFTNSLSREGRPGQK